MKRNKVWIVARHVKRLAFLIVTFILPLLFGGLMVVVALISEKTSKEQMMLPSTAALLIVDESGLFAAEDFPPDKTRWTAVPDEEEAKRRVETEKETTAIIIRKDYLEKGVVDVETSLPSTLLADFQSYVPWDFRRWMSEQLAAGLAKDRLERALHPIVKETTNFARRTETGVRRETRDQQIGRMAAAGAFFMTMFLALMVSGAYLIQGVGDEKENRVLELVVSSVTPTELMLGKLIGLGAVGLLQVAVWCAMGIAAVLFLAVSLVLNPLAFLLCGVFFLLGYAFYGSLMLGIGSLGSNVRESHQYTTVIMMTSMIPMFLWMVIVAEPHGTVARVLSYIPVTAPSTT
ncbi:MAG: ABC transporter permease, partial [Planctomycetota bacterium]